MTFYLYISYKDICWREKIVIPITNVTSLYEEIKRTDNYASHWNLHHPELGGFPYLEDSPLFPTVEECQGVMDTLHIGQMKYVMRSKRAHCSYFCCVKRV